MTMSWIAIGLDLRRSRYVNIDQYITFGPLTQGTMSSLPDQFNSQAGLLTISVNSE